MALVASTLATQLLAMEPTSVEAVAITRLVNAYGVYAAAAMAGSTPITATGVNLGKAAMSSALIGMSAPGAGLIKLPAAVQAFWTAVAGGLATSFALATVVVPPPHAGLAAAFAAVCASNTATNATVATATANIAAVLHQQAIIGGTASFPGPVAFPIV